MYEALTMKVVFNKIRNYVFILAGLNVPEDIFDCSGHNTPLIIMHVVPETFHGVSFSCTSLPVGEYGGIVAFKGTAYR